MKMHRLWFLLAALALAAVVSACSGGKSGEGGSKSGTSTEAPSPTPTEALPPLTPFSPQVEARLHSIRDTVSQIRGLPVYELAQEGVARSEDLTAATLDQFAALTEEDRSDADASLQAMRMLQIVPQDYTLENYAEDYTGDIAGFYSFNHRTLVLVGEADEDITTYDEIILAHEYTHSLQDGAFDLEALVQKYADYPQDDDGLTSYAETLQCMIEGDATFTMFKYAEEVFGPDWRSQIADEPAGSSDSSSDLPEFLQRAVGFDYSECSLFVSQLYDEGGWDAVNAAFENPPATTEQVLDIDKFHDNEIANGTMPADLTAGALPDWTKTDLGQFGMFDIENYVLTFTGDYLSAYSASAGWGSGWVRVYESPAGATITQLLLSFDSAQDLTEFATAFGGVLRAYGVDTSALESSGVRHFTISGSPGYFGALGKPDGDNAAEIVLATDRAALDQATTHLQ